MGRAMPLYMKCHHVCSVGVRHEDCIIVGYLVMLRASRHSICYTHLT